VILRTNHFFFSRAQKQGIIKVCGERRYDMVKHVILWTLKETLTEEEKVSVKADIREGLEGLAGRIPGLTEIRVYTEGLPSSNADLMLDSTFTDVDSLNGYSVHPEHVAVADGKVRPYTATRTCLDFNI
jgi:hypothetical protein